MANKLLITQVLDERQLLIKKIASKTEAASFIAAKKRNEEKVYGARVPEDEFKKNAEASYQQITDLIDRYQKIEAAIVTSNAANPIETSFGTFTVVTAISLRNRLRAATSCEMMFENNLERKMAADYQKYLEVAEKKNKVLNETAENIRLSILGK